jgi:hypothetical protein
MGVEVRVWSIVLAVLVAAAVIIPVAVSRRFRRLARTAFPYVLALVCVAALETALYLTYRDIKVILVASAHLVAGGLLVWLLGRAFPRVQQPAPPEDRPGT